MNDKQDCNIIELTLADKTDVIKGVCYNNVLKPKLMGTILIRNFTKGWYGLLLKEGRVVQGSYEMQITEQMRMRADTSVAMKFYKLCHIFDPRIHGTIPTDIESYASLHELEDPSRELCEKRTVYISAAKDAPMENLKLHEYLNSMSLWIPRIPNLAKIALDLIWVRTTSVDTERSFSQYKHLLTDKCERLI